MPGFNQATVPDQYGNGVANASLLDVWTSSGGSFAVVGQAVYARLQFGFYGYARLSDEVFLAAGADGTLTPLCTGIQFRNAVAGQAATVSAYLGQGMQHPEGPVFGKLQNPIEATLELTSAGVDASAGAYSIVGQNHKTGTNGVATQLQAASLTCAGVSVRAFPTNSGLVYLGKSTVTTGNGYELSPGDAIGLVVANVNSVYFDVDTTGDGVSWIAVG